MNRFDQLIKTLETTHPDDWWIKAFCSERKEDDAFAVKIKTYRRALEKLDDESWRILKNKATESFKQNIGRRGKLPFFNLLNEALAYEYLTESGKENVRLLIESQKQKTPDISFYCNEHALFCEVKTISESEVELDRYNSDNLVSNFEYSSLGEGLFKKLSSTIDRAIEQLPTSSAKNLIYILLSFDDFVGFYYEKYIREIDKFLKGKYPENSIYIRVGLVERANINHVPQ